MPATAGSAYQALRTQHINGIPPNADPQRSTETFAAYVARMATIGLNPDIGATESDSDYLSRLFSYLPPVPLENISSSFAVNAGHEIGPQVSASYALSSSHALIADLALSAGGVVQTASYLEGVRAQLTGVGVDALTITTTTGTGIDVRGSTSGRAIYAQGLLTQALLATQAGIPAGPMNTPVVQVQRSIANLNGQTATSAVFNVTDQYALGTGPLITANTVATEVFKVDQTGSLFSSGSKGFTGDVMLELSGAAITMSFQGGLFIAQS